MNIKASLDRSLEHRLDSMEVEKQQQIEKYASALELVEKVSQQSGFSPEAVYTAANLTTNVMRNMDAVDLLRLLNNFYRILARQEEKK